MEQLIVKGYKKIFEKIWTTTAIIIISGLTGKNTSFRFVDDDEGK